MRTNRIDRRGARPGSAPQRRPT